MKAAHHEIDLALLAVKNAHISVMSFDDKAAREGEEIQVVGYPVASEQIDGAGNGRTYAPTFTTGRVSRVTPDMVQVDAAISKGDSGGPVISSAGKVLGVVAVRALSPDGSEMPNVGGAVSIQSVRSFAPELFERPSRTAHQTVR